MAEEAKTMGISKPQYVEYAVEAMAGIRKGAFRASADVMIRRIYKDRIDELIP